MAVRDVLTRRGLTGNVTPRLVAPPGSIGVPDFTASYLWLATSGNAALTRFSLGGRQGVTAPQGGVVAIPNTDSGSTVLNLWWAYAAQVNVTRVDAATGVRTPVRGASPWSITGAATRRNSAANPTAASDLTGWEAGSNTTLARLTSLATSPSPRVSTAVRATVSSGTQANVTFPLDATSTATTTYGMWVTGPTAPAGLDISVQWYDVNGSSAGITYSPVDATARSQVASGWSWCQATISQSPIGAVFGIIGLRATGLAASQYLDITGRLWENGTSLGPYFDGSFPGGNWIGTSGKSASTLAPIQIVTDGEAPLDREVVYEVSSPLIPGYAARSTSVTLAARGRSWITHPAAPGFPIRSEVLGPFGAITRAITQGIYYPLDSTDGLPIIKTQARRQGRKGSIKILCTSHGERDRFVDTFADGSPVYLRAPASYGYGYGMWLSLGDLTEDQAAYFSESRFRTLSADWTEVAAPLTANEVV